MATYPPAPPPPDAGAPPPQKKTSPLVWILMGCGGLIVLIIIAVVIAVVYVAKNPALVLTKAITAANPNVEVVSVNKASQDITLRDKKTGKTYTITFDDAKNGRITMKEDGNSKATLTVGGKAKLPSWVPDYPGSDPQSAITATSQEGDSGSFAFKTADPSDKVTKYYQDQFQTLGLKVVTNVTSQAAGANSAMLVAQDDATKRNVTVIVGTEGSDTTVSVTYATNK